MGKTRVWISTADYTSESSNAGWRMGWVILRLRLFYDLLRLFRLPENWNIFPMASGRTVVTTV